MTDVRLRHLPSVDSLMRRERVAELIETHGRATVRGHLRVVLTQLRSDIASSLYQPGSTGAASIEIERLLIAKLTGRSRERIGRVINATGVIIHTNLGRARLAQAAVDALVEVGANYCNLEYDLEEGVRGERAIALEGMLCELFGCEAAAVVNNCAAAVLLMLNTLAEGFEVVVSRGELIEIGGSFRIPDVIAKSGARLREVGTTNRTRLADYESAINDQTRVILRAHPSNYRIIGFTESPSVEALSTLARQHKIPLIEDLGSGVVNNLADCGIDGEPTVKESLKAGASLVAFSGDKLFGGPQAGIILGDASLVTQAKRNPLFRALRVDKLTIAALEATVSCYLAERASAEIPTQEAVHLQKKRIDQRARQFKRRVNRLFPDIRLTPTDGFSVVGGGSAPQATLPTTLLRLEVGKLSAVEIEARLRASQPPVVARIIDDQVVIDLRTVTREEESDLLRAIKTVVSGR